MGQVQPLALFFQKIDHPEALLVVLETSRLQSGKNRFACMAKGRMAEIVAQGYGLGQRLVESECAGDGPGDLGHFEDMGQPGPVMIAGRGQKDLRLVFQPAKCLANG